MEIYKTFDGNKVDLDDINIYPEEWRNMTAFELWDKCWILAGRSLFYMNYIYPHMKEDEQYKRVDILCRILSSIRVDNDKFESRDTILKILKWRYVFEDEVENQC